MTPSRCWPACSSRGWTRLPGLILRDHELARDAVQEGFIRAWKNLPTLRDPDRFEGWLRSLVVRSCIDVLRRRGRRPMEVELLPIDGPAVADISSIVADRELLDLALGRLHPDQRAVVVLHYYLGMPLPEVATTLGIPHRNGQVTTPSVARRDARGDRRRPGDLGLVDRGRAARMTTFDRIERRLPELIDELAAATVPDYFDDMLQRHVAVSTATRPGAPSKGGFPWASSPDLSPSGRCRGGRSRSPPLITLLAAATLDLRRLSRTRVPPPFGPARNGALVIRHASMATSPSLGPGDRSADHGSSSVARRSRSTRPMTPATGPVSSSSRVHRCHVGDRLHRGRGRSGVATCLPAGPADQVVRLVRGPATERSLLA